MSLHFIFGSFFVKLIFRSLTPAHWTQDILPTIYVKLFFVISLLECSHLPCIPFGFHLFYISGFQPFQVFEAQDYSDGDIGSCTQNLSTYDRRFYFADPLQIL